MVTKFLVKVDLRIAESTQTIKDRIRIALSQEIRKFLLRVTSDLKLQVGAFLRRIIQETDAWQSLEIGELRGELGIPYTTNLGNILDAWQRNVIIRVKSNVGTNIDAIQMEILGIVSSFIDVLSLSEAEYISAPSGQTIPWLAWLLLRGESVLVEDYIIKKNLTRREFAASRTGFAIMRALEGANYTLPRGDTGTIEDNFVTRRLNAPDVRVFITALIIREFNKSGV